ncbi:hypothetical protein [Neorhizobium sp. NCHU2750]|uniref:hypothetical protein n=1 Tax=Neorhizobium sp. NCHU2750 TaxID=1825976 RepID=UPI000E76C361|nr:hypothetical protein NCHU2750_15100 [Neorhizobium sp. NCHU2750]
MTIKVISFGVNTPHNRLTLVRRGGKRIVLATTIEIDCISERIDKIDSDTAVVFGLEEIPEKVARKVLEDTPEGLPAIVVMEYQKAVKDDVKDKVAAFVAKCVRQVA